MIAPAEPLFMVRHAIHDQLLRAAEALDDDRIGDAQALASTGSIAAALVTAIERLTASLAPAELIA